jgi:DNA polymerase I-like protein with 3'-5' exonuclease and polymerase domains
MVIVHPQLRPLYELRSALGQLKEDGGLTIGADGRNRTSLRPFSTSSGRNAPSTTRFVFGKSTAFRSLIKPEPGMSVVYVDWSQQEFAIAGVLSGDANMLQAYRSGDPYLQFAKQAGAVPATATRHSHKGIREQFKTCMLGINYSMGAKSLARRLKQPLARGRELLEAHRRVYRDYWRWIEKVQDEAMLSGRLSAVFGWQVNVSRDANPRSLKNFPMQGNGAEMMRLACCLATERGIRVIAPVHDALLIESPSRFVQDAVASTKRAMAEASEVVLSGFTLRTDAEIISHPDRYRDARGAAFWSLLMRILERVRKKEKSPPNPL